MITFTGRIEGTNFIVTTVQQTAAGEVKVTFQSTADHAALLRDLSAVLIKHRDRIPKGIPHLQ